MRVDTYAYSGCAVPAQYDPIVAKVITWGHDRAESVRRLQRALGEIALIGVATTLPIQQLIAHHPEFLHADYHTESLRRDLPEDALPEEYARDLAVAAAIAYARRNRGRTTQRVRSAAERLASNKPPPTRMIPPTLLRSEERFAEEWFGVRVRYMSKAEVTLGGHTFEIDINLNQRVDHDLPVMVNGQAMGGTSLNESP